MRMTPVAGKTLYDKVFDAHVVRREADGTCLLYIDRHLVHEVTSRKLLKVLKSLIASRGVLVRC